MRPSSSHNKSSALSWLAGTLMLVFWCQHVAGSAAEDEGMLGVLTPQLEVELEPAIEGQLRTVNVRIGDIVTSGVECRSMCGWTGNSIPAFSPARFTSFRTVDGVRGPPRSVTKT